MNRDPIGYGGGLNLYGYVGGRPTYYVDPSGLYGPGIIGYPPGAPVGGNPSAPAVPAPIEIPNITVGVGVSVGGFVPVPYLPFLPSPVALQVGAGIYGNLYTREWDWCISGEQGFGLGYGGSGDLTFSFSNNSSPEQLANGPYNYFEFNTPYGDYGYQDLPHGGDVYYGGPGLGFEIGFQGGQGGSR